MQLPRGPSCNGGVTVGSSRTAPVLSSPGKPPICEPRLKSHSLTRRTLPLCNPPYSTISTNSSSGRADKSSARATPAALGFLRVTQSQRPQKPPSFHEGSDTSVDLPGTRSPAPTEMGTWGERVGVGRAGTRRDPAGERGPSQGLGISL